MKKITLSICLLLLLSSCQIWEDGKEVVEQVKTDAEVGYDGLKASLTTAKEDAIKAKEEIEKTIEEVKEAADKIKEATEAVSEAVDAVSDVTTIGDDTETTEEEDVDEIDPMESVE